jgi:predicted MPP superfamily phosphohydrolase
MSDVFKPEYKTYIYTGASVVMTALLYFSARKPNSFISRMYLVLGGVQTTLSHFLFSSNAVFPLLGFPGHMILQTGLFYHLLSMSRHRTLKSLWYRTAITWPVLWYFAATWFGLPFAPLVPLASYFGYKIQTAAAAITFSLGALGMYQSLVNPAFGKELVSIDMRPTSKMIQPRDQEPHLHRVVAYNKLEDAQEKHLNIFQITDPHLGPFMSVDRLRGICENATQAVESGQLDLVFLTGDMETTETYDDENALHEALEPFKRIPGKVYACLGNHDYERYNRIKQALQDSSVQLLEDDQAIVSTRVGNIQIIGSVFSFGGSDGARDHIKRLCQTFPKRGDTEARFMLIHNPSVFPNIPEDEAVCVWSGHYHGGQLAIPGAGRYTILRAMASTPLLRRMKVEFPDQGLYCKGRNLLYAHRGTGHYGFPLRMGVSSEQSLHRVYL